MEIRSFDSATYLDSEEAIAAYLAEAGTDGAESLAKAQAVVARARAMARPGLQRGQGVAEPGVEFRSSDKS